MSPAPSPVTPFHEIEDMVGHHLRQAGMFVSDHLSMQISVMQSGRPQHRLHSASDILKSRRLGSEDSTFDDTDAVWDVQFCAPEWKSLNDTFISFRVDFEIGRDGTTSKCSFNKSDSIFIDFLYQNRHILDQVHKYKEYTLTFNSANQQSGVSGVCVDVGKNEVVNETGAQNPVIGSITRLVGKKTESGHLMRTTRFEGKIQKLKQGKHGFVKGPYYLHDKTDIYFPWGEVMNAPNLRKNEKVLYNVEMGRNGKSRAYRVWRLKKVGKKDVMDPSKRSESNNKMARHENEKTSTNSLKNSASGTNGWMHGNVEKNFRKEAGSHSGDASSSRHKRVNGSSMSIRKTSQVANIPLESSEKTSRTHNSSRRDSRELPKSHKTHDKPSRSRERFLRRDTSHTTNSSNSAVDSFRASMPMYGNDNYSNQKANQIGYNCNSYGTYSYKYDRKHSKHDMYSRTKSHWGRKEDEKFVGSNENNYFDGQIVWAKFGDLPWWPGRVEWRPHGIVSFRTKYGSKDENAVRVRWFGMDHDKVVWLSRDRVAPFDIKLKDRLLQETPLSSMDLHDFEQSVKDAEGDAKKFGKSKHMQDRSGASGRDMERIGRLQSSASVSVNTHGIESSRDAAAATNCFANVIFPNLHGKKSKSSQNKVQEQVMSIKLEKDTNNVVNVGGSRQSNCTVFRINKDSVNVSEGSEGSEEDVKRLKRENEKLKEQVRELSRQKDDFCCENSQLILMLRSIYDKISRNYLQGARYENLISDRKPDFDRNCDGSIAEVSWKILRSNDLQKLKDSLNQKHKQQNMNGARYMFEFNEKDGNNDEYKHLIEEFLNKNGTYQSEPKICIFDEWCDRKKVLEKYTLTRLRRVVELNGQEGVRSIVRIPRDTVLGQYYGWEFAVKEYDDFVQGTLDETYHNLYAYQILHGNLKERLGISDQFESDCKNANEPPKKRRKLNVPKRGIDDVDHVGSQADKAAEMMALLEKLQLSDVDRPSLLIDVVAAGKGAGIPKDLILSSINDCRKNIMDSEKTSSDMKVENCTFVQGLVNGWPMCFVITTKAIGPKKQLWTDYGGLYSIAFKENIDDAKEREAREQFALRVVYNGCEPSLKRKIIEGEENYQLE